MKSIMSNILVASFIGFLFMSAVHAQPAGDRPRGFGPGPGWMMGPGGTCQRQ
jgi:hypothetical protein